MKATTILFIACMLTIRSFSQCGTAPTSITANPTISTLTGCRFTLTAVGGVLPAGGNYFWYANSCGGTLLGTGITSPILSVITPTDFFVRIEAPCGNSACASITVTTTSLAPAAVITANGPTTWCSPGSVLLSANTGTGLKHKWKGTAVGTISGATNSTFLVTSGNYGGIYCEVSYSPCWTTTSNTIYVEVILQPTISITATATTYCPTTQVLITAYGTNYTSIQWQLNGTNLVSPLWEVAPQYSGIYTCIGSNMCGSTTSNPIEINILPTNVSISTAIAHLCPGVTSTTLNATGGAGNSWQWRLGQTNISGATNSSYVATSPGSYDCILTNICGTYTSNALSITNDQPPTNISPTGTVDLCSSSYYTLYANNSAGLTWQWQLNGSNIAGATNYFYTVSTAGNYRCMVSNACATLSTPVTTVVGTSLPPATITMSGIAAYCAGTGSVTFTANTGVGITYQWYGSGQTLIPGATNSTYTTNVPGAYYCEETNVCGYANSNSIQLVAPGSPLASITSFGTTSICIGGVVNIQASTAWGNVYQWRYNNVNISGATREFYNATSAGNYDLLVSNTCGSSTSNTITITSVNPVTAAITAGGPTTFCLGGSVLLSANTGPSLTYQWRVLTSPISGATNSTYSVTNGGNINCVVTNACGSSTSNTIAVNVIVPPNSPLISAQGGTAFCAGGSVQLNTTSAAGFTMQWRLNTTPISGATSTTYYATAAGNYDCVATNSCGSATSNSLSVTLVTPVPGSITAGGPTTFCQGGSVLLSANTGFALTYLWRRNTSPISGATTSTYVANQSGNYDCIVYSLISSCPTTISNVITVAVNAGSTATITPNGPLTYCSISPTTLSANIGTGFTYSWRKNGSVISGATASTYTPTSSGSYTVTITSICGSVTSSAVSITVLTAPAVPGTISGPGNFCSGQAGVVYSIAPVANATSYLWQVPNGAVITSGQGTTSITVTFGNKNGNIRVQAVNNCGNSNFRSKNVNKNCREADFEPTRAFEITVFPNPGSIFNLEVTDSGNPYSYILSDLTGLLIEQRDNIQPGTSVQLGENLSNGVYLVQIVCGEERRVLKLIKQ